MAPRQKLLEDMGLKVGAKVGDFLLISFHNNPKRGTNSKHTHPKLDLPGTLSWYAGGKGIVPPTHREPDWRPLYKQVP